MFDDSFKVRYKTIPVAISEKTTYFPVPPHNHAEIEVLVILKGKAKVRINDKVYLAAAGDIFFVNPLEVHSILTDRESAHLHRCICFDCSLIGDPEIAKKLRTCDVALPWMISFENPHNAFIRQIFDTSYDLVAQDADTMRMEIPAYITLLIAYVIKNNMLRDNITRHGNTAFCDRVHQYISERYASPITSKQAAEELNFNQSYFCRTFRHNFGMTFSEYLNSYRVFVSKPLLEEGKQGIAEIALACGFTNSEYFTRSFKKYLGIVPTTYKKSIQY